MAQNGLNSPVNLQVSIPDGDDHREEILIQWEHDTTGNSTFLGYFLYENDEQIGNIIPSDTSVNKTLTEEDTYIYKVRAAYYDGYSEYSNRGIVTYHETDYFQFTQGNPNATVDIWTIYLQNGELGETYFSPGDELAIYDGELLVGKMHVNKPPVNLEQDRQSLIAFTEFPDGSGYTPGNSFSFKFYDASMDTLYTIYDYAFSDEVENAYAGNVFPEGEVFSVLSIEFEADTPTPVNLDATSNGHDVHLSWQEPTQRDLIGHHIYRDGQKITETPVNGSEYIDEELISGQYEYYIKAVYDEGTSLPSEPVAVTIDYVEFNPLEIDEPESPMEVIIHQAEIMGDPLDIFDELGVFKYTETDTICVAAVSLKEDFIQDTLFISQNIEGTNEIDGFNPDDTLFYRLYDYSSDKTYQDVLVSFPENEEDTSLVFIPNGTTHVNLNWLPYAPVNLSYEVEDYDIHLSWEESPNNSGLNLNLLGYNVYRDYEKINAGINQTNNYTDTNLYIDTYAYHIEAVYQGSLSRWSDSVEVTIANQFFLPIQETESEDNMTFEFFGARVDGVPLVTYDQVAVFAMTDADTLICVGAGSVRDSITDSETMTIRAYRDNPETPDIKDGFAEDDSIYYKFWDESTGNVYSYLERSFPFEAELGYNHDAFSFGDTCKISLDFFTPPPVKFILDDDTTYCRNSTGHIEITTEDFKNIDGLSFSLELDTSRYNYDTLLVRQDFLANSNISFSGNTLSIEWTSDVLQTLDGYDTLYTVATDIHENGNSYLNWKEESDFSGREYLTGEFHNTDFFIEKLPENPGIIDGDDQVCNGTAFSVYSVSAIGNADGYIWELSDSDAGEVNNNGTEAMVLWNNDFEGSTTLMSSGENQCGTGASSEKSIEITNTVNTSVSIEMSEAECEGDTITFTATGINGGNNPEYNWYINNAMHYSHNTALISDNFVDEDEVYCELISSSECVQNNPAQSETIELDLNPKPSKPNPVTGPEEICNTVGVSYYMTPGAQNADTYSWALYPSNMGEIIADGYNAEIHWNTDTFGTAYIEVRGVNNCGTGPARQFITVRDYCTEINKPETPSLTIFPNPFRNRITISLPALKTGASCTISDLKGNRLLQKPLESSRQEVSLDQLPRGMYILKIINGKEVSYRKVVKR